MSNRNSLLLLSNSKNYGSDFLDHALEPIERLVSNDDVVFVPFALADHQAYGDVISTALSPLSISVQVATPDRSGAKLISEASVLFVGGGNTFRLLKTIQGLDVMPAIRERFANCELRYMGSSAGTNLACPTIRTTNDMPIVSPEGFEALGLVPFQINAHFQDDDAFEGHMGETRRTRLIEFLEENDAAIVALREGAWLANEPDGGLTVGGDNGAILFRRSQTGVDEHALSPGDNIPQSALGQPAYDSRRQVVSSGSQS